MAKNCPIEGLSARSENERERNDDRYPAFTFCSDADDSRPAFSTPMFFDNKENVEPCDPWSADQNRGHGHGQYPPDDDKPGPMGGKDEGKDSKDAPDFENKKSKSPLPEDYPRAPLQDITAVLYPDQLPHSLDMTTPKGKGKRKGMPILVEDCAPENRASNSSRRTHLQQLSSHSSRNIRKMR